MLVGIIALILNGSDKCFSKDSTIIHLRMLSGIDTNDIENRCKTDHFLMKSFCQTKKEHHILDSIICNLIDKDFLEYDQYNIYIYKESEFTNVTYLKNRPNSIGRGQDDLVVEYTHLQANYFHKTIHYLTPMSSQTSYFELDCLKK